MKMQKNLLQRFNKQIFLIITLQKVFEIEEILGKRVKNGKIKYLVK